MVNYQHISLAPTNQSGCKGCGEKILQGQVRFGQTTTNRYGVRSGPLMALARADGRAHCVWRRGASVRRRYGAIAWRHLACATNTDPNAVNEAG